MMDDLLSKSKDRVKLVHDVAVKHSINVWAPLIALLNREDKVITHMASRLIAKLATRSKVRMPDPDLIFYLNWLKDQLTLAGNEYLQSVAEGIHMVMRVDD